MQLFSVSFDRWKDFLFFQSCLPRVPPPPSPSRGLQNFSIHLKPGIYSKGEAGHRHPASGQ